MDSLYQEKLEKETVQKEVNISLDDEGIMKVLLCCQAGRSCNECPYDELNSPRCRDILLNECIGLINRLKQAKIDVAREIIEELARYLRLNEDISLKCKEENGEQNREYFKGKLAAFKQIRGFIDAELKNKCTEGGK